MSDDITPDQALMAAGTILAIRDRLNIKWFATHEEWRNTFFALDNTVATLRGLAAQLQAAQSRSVRPEWVPCSERMPALGESVLGYFPHSGAVVHTRLSRFYGSPAMYHWATHVGDYHRDSCTHWHPLPPAPVIATPDPGQFSPGPTP